MSLYGLSAEAICRELTRLLVERMRSQGWSIDAWEVIHVYDGHRFFQASTDGGLVVSVKLRPLEFSASLRGGKTHSVTQGGADRFLRLDAFSVRFLEPAAAVLCNCIAQSPGGVQYHHPCLGDSS